MTSFRRIAFILIILAMVLSACGKVTTGITGKVYIGTCIGDSIAEKCTPDTFYPTSLTIYDNNVNKIKTVKTKGDGTFTIALKPGNYFIHPENAGKFPMAADFRVKVTKGELAELTIIYDTGLRPQQNSTP